MLAVKNDNELDALLKGVLLHGAGVKPHMVGPGMHHIISNDLNMSNSGQNHYHMFYGTN